MRIFKSFRQRTRERFIDRTGCDESVAELAAVAIHPFDNRRRPATRSLENRVRQLSYEFTRASRAIHSAEELRTGARRVVRLYLEQAKAAGDGFYAEQWQEALAAIVRTAESFGIAFSSDSIEERRLNVVADRPEEAPLPTHQLLLPEEVRARAIDLMFQFNNDPPDQPLSREKAEKWIDFETLNSNWHRGWIEDSPQEPTKVYPDPEAWIGTRDLDASAAVSTALQEAGFDPRMYFRLSPSERATARKHAAAT